MPVSKGAIRSPFCVDSIVEGRFDVRKVTEKINDFLRLVRGRTAGGVMCVQPSGGGSMT